MFLITLLLPLLLVAIVDSQHHGHDSRKDASQPQAVGFDNAGLNSMIMNLINNRINKQVGDQAVRSMTNPKTVRSGKSSNTSHGVETKYSEVEAKLTDLAASPNNLLSKSAAFASKFANIKSDGYEPLPTPLPMPTVTTEEPTDETTSEEPIPPETTSEEPIPPETTSEETTTEEDNTPDNSMLAVPTFKPYVYKSTVSPQLNTFTRRVKTRAARSDYDEEDDEDNDEDTDQAVEAKQKTINYDNKYVKLSDVMKLLKIKGMAHVQKQKQSVNENLVTLLDAFKRASIKVKDNGRRTIKTAKRSRTLSNAEENHNDSTEEQKLLGSLKEELDKLIISKAETTTTHKPPTTQPEKVRSGADLGPIMSMISSLTNRE